MGDTFRVLHVCTGNLCRSPMAEHLMRAALQARLGGEAEAFQLSSAGTMGRAGGLMEPYARDVLTERGVDGTAFRVRELATEQVAAADLVLTATRQHRVAVVELDPTAASRTFTLREFARLLDGLGPSSVQGDDAVVRARTSVAAVAAGRRPAARPRDDDLADPYQGPRRGFTACAAVIDDALRAPIEVWTGRDG